MELSRNEMHIAADLVKHAVSEATAAVGRVATTAPVYPNDLRTIVLDSAMLALAELSVAYLKTSEPNNG